MSSQDCSLQGIHAGEVRSTLWANIQNTIAKESTENNSDLNYRSLELKQVPGRAACEVQALGVTQGFSDM